MRQGGEATFLRHGCHGLVSLAQLNCSLGATQVVYIFGKCFAKTAPKKSTKCSRTDMDLGCSIFNGQIVRQVLVNPTHHPVNSPISLVTVAATCWKHTDC